MRHDGPVNTRSAALLEPRLVGEVEGTFFVRDYQRGYRWGADEVRRLLDDIKDAGGRNYYLQPVVVKRLEDGRWELVDGQQRLTTLYLVLRYIKRHMPTAELRLHGDLRDPARQRGVPRRPHRGGQPREHRLLPHVPGLRVHRGLVQRAEEPRPWPRSSSITALSKTVHVIWYEAPGHTRVRLPNPVHPPQRRTHPADRRRAGQGTACSHGSSVSTRSPPSGTASSATCTSPEVWAFATGTADGGAHADQPPAGHHRRYERRRSGRTRSAALPHVRDASAPHRGSRHRICGTQVVDLHSLVLGWYDDRDLFHKIGYLVAAGRSSFLELVGVGARDARSPSSTLHSTASSATASSSRERCRVADVRTADEDEAGSPPDERRDRTPQNAVLGALLLRRPRPAAVVPRAHPRPELARSQHGRAVDRMAGRAPKRSRRPRPPPKQSSPQLKARIDDGTAEPLTPRRSSRSTRELTTLFTRRGRRRRSRRSRCQTTTATIDAITNLALLDRDDNSVLSNAVFEVKRRHIIELDRGGSYIPVCTRNVFLKYYTDAGAQQLHFWGPQRSAGLPRRDARRTRARTCWRTCPRTTRRRPEDPRSRQA